MRAVTIREGRFGVDDVADPAPRPSEVVVRVRASGLNAADLLQARGGYPAPAGWPADIPGLEIAGVVEACGAGVDEWVPGDRVMALVGGGGHAQRIALPADTLVPVPTGIDDSTAAGFMEAFATSWDGLIDQAGLRAGERVLITGAAGGVGNAMSQIACLAGAKVVASVRNRELHARLAELVPAAVVVTPDEEVEHGPYDVIVELVGGIDTPRRVDWLAPYGRILVIGVLSERPVPLALFALMARRARILGSTIRSRPAHEKAELARTIRRGPLSDFASGRLRVPVDSIHTLDHSAVAFARLAAPGKFGKVVLDNR